MNEVIKSIQVVSSSPYFFFYMGLIITFGMIIGVHLDDGVRGFKRSLTIIMPFLIMTVITTLSRIYSISHDVVISFQAYNGTVSFLISSFFYIIGLFIGHSITYKATKAAKGKYEH